MLTTLRADGKSKENHLCNVAMRVFRFADHKAIVLYLQGAARHMAICPFSLLFAPSHAYIDFVSAQFSSKSTSTLNSFFIFHAETYKVDKLKQ